LILRYSWGEVEIPEGSHGSQPSKENAMRVNVYGHNLELNADLREHAGRRIQFALARFSRRIREVKVRLTDVNANRGGPDKLCRIVARLIPTGTVVVEDVDVSAYAAVALAAERAGRSVARELRRRLELRRHVPWQVQQLRSRKHRPERELAHQH
jgi:putative sigma-54 modulation protein